MTVKKRKTYADYYEYKTMTIEEYERRKKKRIFNNEWIVFEVSLNNVKIRRAIG
tara:strand:+ start:477 stop:638 length:162 start_codon:yes stop_codon:yes gene_type:complete